ncbi:membrane protein insertion efficiency factor YidD [Desulfobacula sp.]|uniref:membrane protein insertion efficiency factor YidD n=1 Tax=Desulfobacula sp. TaxID=2593537 RepID=UPI0025C367ED|nr:membrane protein insertion efficiency factor YidD [Desulfobacula sp.]MBC2704562.1 membrane protein insertion efficiency factor YidD [Desulfobacula sp.]
MISIFVILFILSLCETPFALDQNFLFKFYQEHISVVDGNRCSMYPSCSRYASRAFEKHGPVLGWIMTCDRLVRCGRDEVKLSEKVIMNHQELIYDSVEANDFWWFEKEKKE